jgi:outer membrane receptor for ferric coprogen and ferric-rhodotorulic acid
MKKGKKMAVGGLSSLVTDGEQSSVTIPGRTTGNAGAMTDMMSQASSFAPATNDFRPYSEYSQEAAQPTSQATGQAMKSGGKATCKMSSGGKRSSKCPSW